VINAYNYIYPLSLCQQRLWLLDQLRPFSPVYNLSTVIPITAAVNPAILEQSCNIVVARHDILRTTFDICDNVPSQNVHPMMNIPLEGVSLDPALSVSAALLDSVKRPFDLRAGPLLRTTLFRVSSRLHLFLVTMHHIVSDARSVEVFMTEVQRSYAALIAGVNIDLPELHLQYSDYSVWQREYLAGPKLHADLEFWTRSLADLPTLSLPLDFSRKLDPSFEGNEVPVLFEQSTVRELAKIGQRQGATLFMTFLAAFYALLARYTLQDDIVLGTPVSGRSQLHLEELIGFFVNSLVLRCNLAGDPTFETLVSRVRAAAVAAYAHQELPFEILVEKLKPPRDLSRNPLFQILFQLQHAPPTGEAYPAEPDTSPPLLRTQFLPFDLAMNLWERSGQVGGTLQYATDLFRSETAGQMARHYVNLVRAAAANPGVNISKLRIVDDNERRLILADWNKTSLELGGDRSVHSWVQFYASSTPDAAAIVTSDQTLAYSELNQLADSLAVKLQENGVRREVRVAVFMERSPAAIISILAIWKAGGVYVPIDPEYPPDRARFMWEDSDSKVLLVSERTAGHLDACSDRELIVGDPPPASEESSGTGAAAPSGPTGSTTADDLAYIIYTSGSTGQPKGVMIQHYGLSNVVAAQRALLPVTVKSRVLQFAPLCFDASVFELALAFGSGAAICVPGRDYLLPQTFEFAKTLDDLSIDTVVIPPPVLATVDPKACATLKVILMAGDVCPVGIAEAWSRQCRVFNLYGPTEATIWATCAELSGDGRRPPIGRPIPNTRAYVLDQHRSPAPIGIQGELYLAGRGLARGYLNQIELTTSSFVPNPFDSSDEYGTLYRTGDICKYARDGQLEYIGRLDRQVKVRGFRIELDEVEAALRTSAVVQDCCAAVRAKESAGACIIAYVVPRSLPTVEALQDLRTGLARQLPPYMIPASILFIHALPLTPNGKIDRDKLAREDVEVSQFERPVAEPRNAIEKAICSVWREVLGLNRVGVEDSFFDLGGHSLLAVRARTLLANRIGKPIKIADLFQYPTPASLAGHLFSSDEDHSLVFDSI
jgi:amino acid adenylation domain-containing protein